ncbi:MAG: metallophosphoesterase family protein [Oligosphaeraceae bacterium]
MPFKKGNMMMPRAAVFFLCLLLLASLHARTTDESPKGNFGFGREFSASSVAEIARELSLPEDTPYLVLISDLHFFPPESRDAQATDGVYAKNVPEDVEALVDFLKRLDPAPSMVLLAGDLVHQGTPEAYGQLKELFSQLPGTLPVMAIPGNHDDREAMEQILEEAWTKQPIRKVGGWTIVGLDTGRQGTLSETQQSLLRQGVAEAGGAPLLILTHHSLVQQPGWEPIRPLRETLLRTTGMGEQEIWMVSGHAHANFLFQLSCPGYPLRPMLTHTAGSSAYGYDTPSLRLLFLDKEKMLATVLWRFRESPPVARVDPPWREWPLYENGPLDPRLLLQEWQGGQLQEMAWEWRGVGEHPDYCYVDGDGRMLLVIPVVEYAAYAPLTVELEVESDCRLRGGLSPEALEEIFDSRGRIPRKIISWEVPEEGKYGLLFLEVCDRTPQDGFGAFLRKVRLLGKEKEVLP